jgi:hypothetical protein
LSRSLIIEGILSEQLPRLTQDFDGSIQSTGYKKRLDKALVKTDGNFPSPEKAKV